MNCTKCGATLQAGDKFCSGCGSPAGTQFCPSCGKQVTTGASFCANCGKSLQGGDSPQVAPAAKASGDKNIPAGETVIMDTGTFPISYAKSMMSAINGKLSLTHHYLVFKASALQGVGGIAPTAGLFIPNPAEAGKAKTHFSIRLAEITSIESGWSHVTVVTTTGKYKFGAMLKTKEWVEAINNARAQA